MQHLPSYAEQIATKKRLNALFRPNLGYQEPKKPKPKKLFIENPNAPRCSWPRRDWLLITGEPYRPTIREIIDATSIHFDIPKVDILSQRRTANVVMPRQIAMYLSKTLTLHSLPEIGRRFSNRDHTTILHAVRKIASLKETEQVSKSIAAIKQMVMG